MRSFSKSVISKLFFGIVTLLNLDIVSTTNSNSSSDVTLFNTEISLIKDTYADDCFPCYWDDWRQACTRIGTGPQCIGSCGHHAVIYCEDGIIVEG